MLRFQWNRRKPELNNFFRFTSRHCLTWQGSHGRPLQPKNTNNTSQHFGQELPESLPESKTFNGNIFSELSLRDLDEKMTSAGLKREWKDMTA